MEDTPLTLRLELLVSQDSLRGQLVAPDGERIEFLGRVGLFAALECLVVAAVSDAGRTRAAAGG
jgi:hypothetical protein